MGKKTEREEDRIFKPPESPHFQTAADNLSVPQAKQEAAIDGKASFMSNREPFWQSVLPPSSGLLHRCAYIRAQVGRFTNRNGRVNQTIPANRKSLLSLPGQNPAVS